MSCVVCSKPSDKHHIRTRGAGAGNEEWETMNLCRSHHTEIHAIGNYTFCKKYPIVLEHLKLKGWEFNVFNKLRRHVSENS